MRKISELVDTMALNWVPPIRCGKIKARAITSSTDYDRDERYVVNKILAWDDIVNWNGETKVTYWSMKYKGHKRKNPVIFIGSLVIIISLLSN